MPVTSVREVAVLIRFSRLSGLVSSLLLAGAVLAISLPVAAQSAPPPPPVPGPNGTPLPPPPPGAPAAQPPGMLPTPIPVLSSPTDTPGPVPTGASATPEPRRHRGGHPNTGASPTPPPAPTATPTAPGFATLDGTWEVQLQHADSTDYSYLEIKQSGTTLTGSWRVKKQTYPFAESTFDGKLVRIVVTTPTGAQTFAGYVENGTDMVGTLDAGNKTDPTPFTAGHRGKDKGLFGPGLSPAGIPLPGAGGTGSGNFPH